MIVWVIQARDRTIVVITDNRDKALDKCRAFNSDPFLDDGRPDVGAPYTVEAWTVRQ